MSAIKIHLDPAEAAAIDRYAAVLHVSREDIAYAALDRLMKEANNSDVRREIAQTRDWRKDNLPLWADTERSVHAYEGAPDDQPEERIHFD
jgi:hypothetical protein